jgi:DMSO/TMAO reductase YedYZ molybdopterin-dependent catalytic subunit
VRENREADAREAPSGRWARRALAALSGLLAAGAALAVAELAAALLWPGGRPVTAIGGAAIDRTPPAVKDWAIRSFGTADKLVLQLGIVAVLALLALAVGLLALRLLPLGAAGAAAFGVFGAVVAVGRPEGRWPDGLPSLLGGAAAALVLVLLIRRLTPQDRPAGESAARVLGPLERRAFLRAAGTVAAASAGAGLLGRYFMGSNAAEAEAARAALTLPRPDDPAGPLPPGADLQIDGLSPFTTPTKDFYRVDTALQIPRPDADRWRLRIHGLGLDRELELSYRDLLGRELLERDITLTCVSNQVGGPYAGNARWIGVSLADLLREAGLRAPSAGGPADQLVSRSVDGMTIGTPVETVLDGRDALLAVGMNGEPLPFRHGFPVRMVVPGLYGYVSACKWLTELELTTFADFDAYWVRRDWAAQAPIKTQSRIDTPRAFTDIAPGMVRVAGVAWAQHTGIDRVEVRVDGGDWQRARLAPAPSRDTWRQWAWEWQAEPGSHRLEVRATDLTGKTQTEERVGTVPDGATGWHSVVVSVD